jgi:hemerythrin
MSHQRRRKSRQNPLDSLKHKVEAEMRQAGRELRIGPSTGEKMSEVLSDFIEPWIEAADTLQAYDKLLGTAIIAWNAALLPKDQRRKMLDEAVRTLEATTDRQTAKDFQAIMADFIRRKERHFADNKRFIFSYEVKETKDGFHLAVASTP